MVDDEPDELVYIVTVAKLSAFLDRVDPTKQKRKLRASAAFGAIIKAILGEDWFDKNVAQKVTDTKAAAGYVGYDFSDARGSEHKVLRIYELCEMLLNLQLVPGFHDRMNQLKSLSLEQIESAYAELQSASILYWHGLNFRFVEKRQNPTKGKDYDLEVFRNGRPIYVEAKCKFESTAINVRSISESLKEARTQLPDNGPSSIFVKIPQRWFSATGNTLASEIERETRRFFGSTGRVMSIVYYTPVSTFSDSAILVNHRYREVENLSCRYRHVTEALLKDFEAMKEWSDGTPRWVRLMDIIEGKL